jgi:hypothetical protein
LDPAKRFQSQGCKKREAAKHVESLRWLLEPGSIPGASTKAYPQITKHNSTMKEGHRGVVLGSEVSGGIRNLVFENCWARTSESRGLWKSIFPAERSW